VFTGCARAESAIKVQASSSTAIASSSISFITEAEICERHESPEVFAVGVANAYAEAVAATLIVYNSHVCTCCTGNSKAFTSVAAGVQAVAKAYAEACASAVASVSCYNDLLAGASTLLSALAEDTQVAVDSVYQAYVSDKGKKCVSSGLVKQIKSAVAKAVACVFYNIYVAYNVANDVSDAYSCGATKALSGPDWALETCTITYCPTD
jgi:hypothetical protein